MKLQEITNITPGHPFRGAIPEKAGSCIRVVQLKDISKSGCIDWEGSIEAELETKKEPDWLKPGDILFSARGNRNFATIITKECPSNALAAPYFYVIKNISNKVLPSFITWQLNKYPCQKYFQKESEGTLIKSIRKSVLEHTTIEVPTLDKQMHIIKIAEILEREKQLCEQLIQNGEVLMSSIASSLYHEQNK